MTLALIPDAEKILSRYLREHAAIVPLGARVVGKSPSATGTAWILVRQLDANNVSETRVEHLISYMVQLDCYAGATGGQPEARALALTARAVLMTMPDVAHDSVVVSKVEIVGDLRNPDTAIEGARERVILTAVVHAHATSGGS